MAKRLIILWLMLFLLAGCQSAPAPTADRVMTTFTSVPPPTATVLPMAIPTATIPPTAIPTATELPPTSTPPQNWKGLLALVATTIEDVNRNPKLYLFQSGDKVLTPILPDRYVDFTIQWTGDGARLIFPSYSTTDVNFGINLYILNISNMSTEKIAFHLDGGVNYYHPSWSPDSKQIAFVQDNGSALLIHILDLYKHTLRPLTEGDDPSWLDENNILYIKKNLDANGKMSEWGDIYQIQINNGINTQLTKDAKIRSFSISRDRIHLAYINLDYDVYVMNNDGANEKLIYSEIFTGFWLPTLSWNPDGKTILASDECKLLQVPIDGGESQYLTGLPEGYCYLFGTMQP
jgi:hypothetical protein